MRCYIADADRYDDLTYIKDGIDIVLDFIGNNSGFCNKDFVLSDDLNAYVTNEETFNWWHNLIECYQHVDRVILKLTEETGDDIEQILYDSKVFYSDYITLPAAVLRELEKLYGKEKLL